LTTRSLYFNGGKHFLSQDPRTANQLASIDIINRGFQDASPFLALC